MKFKAVDWVRKVRNKNCEKCKKMTPQEKIEETKLPLQSLANKSLNKMAER